MCNSPHAPCISTAFATDDDAKTVRQAAIAATRIQMLTEPPLFDAWTCSLQPARHFPRGIIAVPAKNLNLPAPVEIVKTSLRQGFSGPTSGARAKQITSTAAQHANGISGM
jgi:hypothetical protein